MNTHLNCILYSRAYRCCNQLQLLIPFQESYDALCIKCILTHTACYLILYGNSDMIAWRVILYEYVEFKQLKRHLQPCARWSMRTIFMDLILGLTCLSLALSFVLPIIYTASTSTTSPVISCNISYTASTSTTSPVTAFNISYTASTSTTSPVTSFNISYTLEHLPPPQSYLLISPTLIQHPPPTQSHLLISHTLLQPLPLPQSHLLISPTLFNIYHLSSHIF